MDNWNTPEWLMRHFCRCYDPCPEVPLEDGLKCDWSSPAYVNPPYSEPKKWIMKAIEQQRKGVDVVMLLRVDASTGWYKMLIEAGAHIAYFNERLHFSGSVNGPPFCSMLAFLEAVKSNPPSKTPASSGTGTGGSQTGVCPEEAG